MAAKRKPPTGKPFTKGDPRINRGGRPKGFSRAIRDLVGDDPTNLAKVALDIANGKPAFGGLSRAPRAGESLTGIPRKVIVPSFDNRLDALTFVRDTGWGKPTQPVEISEVEVEAEEFDKLPRAEQAKQLREAAAELEAEVDE